MKKEEVLLVILNDYADWEGAFLAAALNGGVMPGSETKYAPKTVAPTLGEVRSLGGFRTLPDYSFQDIPSDYSALVLIGGYGWQSPEAGQAVPLVEDALNRGKTVGGICDAVSFLAAHGFLNHVRHTGNTLARLKQWGGERYANENGYREVQAVSDQNIVTANGTGYLEFTCELLSLLQADRPENIGVFYDFNKNGFVK